MFLLRMYVITAIECVFNCRFITYMKTFFFPIYTLYSLFHKVLIKYNNFIFI
jgi:hypothetical protein